jgi:hypothetical protein
MKIKPMKIVSCVVWLIMIGLLQPLVSNAREVYALSWRGTKYRATADGRIVAVPYSQKDIIAKAALDNGIADVRSLAFVYVADDHDAEVVFAATGEHVQDIFQFEYSFVEVDSSDGATAVRQAFIFNEAYDSAIGSAFGIERSRRTNGERIGLSYKGNFQFSFPDRGEVYSGTFTTGKRIK